MVYYPRRRRNYRRRPYRKKRMSQRAKLMRVPRPLIKETAVTRHTWVARRQFAQSGKTQHSYQITDLEFIDPLLSAASNYAPSGYEKMSNIYLDYRVIAAKCSILFWELDTGPTTCILYANTNATKGWVDDTNTALALPNLFKARTIGGGGSYFNPDTTNGVHRNGAVIKSNWEFPYKLWGLERNDDNAVLHRQPGAVIMPANERTEFRVQFEEFNDGAFHIRYFIKIEYIVEWSQQKHIVKNPGSSV